MRRKVQALFAAMVLTLSAPTCAEEGPLAGKIWDLRQAKFISTSELIEELLTSDYLLIGERHGRIAHQNREAFLLAALAEKGVYPDLYLEMLPRDQTKTVEYYRGQEPEYAGRLAISLNWAASNWPSWSYYQPVFDIALMAKLKIGGADLKEDEKRRINKLDRDIESYDPDVKSSWRESMRKAHCELIKDDRLARVTQLQILRDQGMANALRSESDVDTMKLLIAGSAHTRLDRGVPRYLNPGEKTVSLALMEAAETDGLDQVAPKSIDPNSPVYDFIWFTPKVEEQSVCDRLVRKKS